MSDISKRIFIIMKEQGITQKELAEACNIGQSTISDWKTKGTDPQAKHIIPIAKALGQSTDFILGGL